MLEEKGMQKNFYENHFKTVLNKDLANAIYNVYASPDRCIDFKLHGQKLLLACEDYGEECKRVCGKDEYEFYYELDKENTQRFFTELRNVYGLGEPIEVLLKKVFGCDEGTVKFVNFCKEHKIKAAFYSFYHLKIKKGKYGFE